MPNPLLKQFSGQASNNGFQSMMEQFNKFRSQFQGDPRQKVQELLNSGKMSQQQYNQIYQAAQNFMQFLPH